MRVALACTVIASAAASPALAQYAGGVSATAEVASEERRRGLSWSDGNPVVSGMLSVPFSQGLRLDATSVSLWDSRRHGGADGVVDLDGIYVRQVGGWRLSARAGYHLFLGASDQDYGEVSLGAGLMVGPASIDLNSSYAPRQSSIGGDNLYLSVSAGVGVPGTPFTVSARIGRSSGHARDPVRSARLRPDGRYWDHGISVDYLKGRWFAGLRYANSSIDGPARRHARASLIGRVGLSL